MGHVSYPKVSSGGRCRWVGLRGRRRRPGRCGAGRAFTSALRAAAAWRLWLSLSSVSIPSGARPSPSPSRSLRHLADAVAIYPPDDGRCRHEPHGHDTQQPPNHPEDHSPTATHRHHRYVTIRLLARIV